MVSPTPIEAHRRFAPAIDEPRRKCLSEFDVWLNAAIAKGADPMRRDSIEHMGLIRIGMAEAFVRSAVPAVIKELNPDAGQDFAQNLDTFAAHDPLPRSVNLAVAGTICRGCRRRRSGRGAWWIT